MQTLSIKIQTFTLGICSAPCVASRCLHCSYVRGRYTLRGKPSSSSSETTSVGVGMNSNPALPISDGAVLPWPRRTSKACASCRRDKIRCDGSRPCGGCRKKGYPAEQCTEGCEPCRRARVRCEEGKPCPRCGELGLECSASPVLAMHAPPLASMSSAGARHTSGSTSSKSAASRAGDRAKLACSNCRRDNKKCDDQRPCSRCVARSEECVHLPRGPKLIKLRCEECRMHNKRCEETRPCQYCIDLGNQCVTATRKGRGHGTRVKAACVACRCLPLLVLLPRGDVS
ncbi:hypothetical protein HYPSUDRAFT_795681 [Hypholoma sublateritium FD-334 SS-4]|uniref:Zn(2)-C6 fungal-type domain-containing protein n=1 Tax=Hypholoma sublateritium (strain FD-334 SS-4) TaxID=945553 RepID=A0A0D2MVM5_HYPSF|nr:hypothetical protein HYPSUDRAFT_795681 [Hypholoma sublateritium FD-334 SS-4]